MKYKILFFSQLLGMIYLFPSELMAQLSIRGPQCVTAGIVYQYMINGAGDSSSSTRICVSNGKIEKIDARCATGGAPFILIQWDDTASSGNIMITSAKGNKELNVNIVSPLLPGAINEQSRTQRIDFNRIHNVISCSSARGGSCSPNYLYQWQYSTDCLTWNIIRGANGQELSVDSPIKETTYYRRKVIDTLSNSEKYSDVAIVFVNPDLEGHMSTTPVNGR